jgi:cell division septation protein DedD
VAAQWLFQYIQTAPTGKSGKDMATLKSDKLLPKTKSSWQEGYYSGSGDDRHYEPRQWNAELSAFKTPEEEEAAIIAENAAYQKALNNELVESFKPDPSSWATKHIVPGSVKFAGFEEKPTGEYEFRGSGDDRHYEEVYEDDRTRPTYQADFDANGTKFTGSIGPDGKFKSGSTGVTKGDYQQLVNADGSTTWSRYRDKGGVTEGLGVLLSVASFIPGIGPFAAAANSALNLSQGNTTGAILSGLGAYGGFAGQELAALNAAEASGDIINASRALDLKNAASNAKLATTAISGANALASGNEVGAINALLSGAGQMGVELPSGVTTGVQAANLAAAISSGDTAGALRALGDMSGSSDAKTAAAAVRLANVLQSDNPNPQVIVNAATGLYGHVSKGTPADIRLAPPTGPVPTLEEILSKPPVESEAAPEPSPVDDPTLEEILSSPQPPVEEEPAPAEPSPVDDPTLEEILGQPAEPSPVDDPTLEEILSQPEPAEPPDDSRPDEEESGSKGPTDEDRARRFKEERDRYLAYLEAGEPLPPEYGVQDMGITDENWDAYNQHMLEMDERGELPSQWRPGEDGSFKYTDDDGSTITIDENGDVIDVTEAPPGMLPGEEPEGLNKPTPVTPGTPALVKPTTPTPSKPTPGTSTPSTPTPATPNPAEPKAQASSNVDLAALLALLGGGGGGGSAPPTQVAPAEVQLMEEIFGSNLFSKDPGGISAADAKAGKRNFNDGGSIDELLHLLRG